MMRFSAILYKRENFCDFLFAFLHIKSFLKRGINSFLLEKNPFQKYGKKYFSRLSHLNMYSNPFSLACPRLLDIGFADLDCYFVFSRNFWMQNLLQVYNGQF